jgi:hypothetical protein
VEWPDAYLTLAEGARSWQRPPRAGAAAARAYLMNRTCWLMRSRIGFFFSLNTALFSSIRLRPLFPTQPSCVSPDADIHAVYVQQHRSSVRVRALVDFVAGAFDAERKSRAGEGSRL